MLRVIKPDYDYVVHTDNVVYIPDLLPPEEFFDTEEEEDRLPGEETEDGEDNREDPEAVAAREQARIARETAESNVLSLKVQEEARRILEVARLEGENILKQAREEGLRLREQARQEGFLAAQEEHRSKVREMTELIKKNIDRMIEDQNQYFEKYETQLKYLALDIAEKVLQKTISESSTEMSELIRHAVSSAKNADWISVEVSNRLVTLIHSLRKEYSPQQNGRRVEFEPKEIPADSCVVRTAEGVIDASVPTQLENLRNLFIKMDEGSL